MKFNESVPSVPLPTEEYRRHRKLEKATAQPGTPTLQVILPPPPRPLPGTRVLIWKQDPTVAEIGIRKAYLANPVLVGPKDARITTQGLLPVTPNVLGDFIQVPNTDAFDAVHTFAIVRQTLTMYQRAFNGTPLPWQWNSSTNTDPLNVFPHAGNTMNAFYSRNEKALKFFFFNKPGDPSTAPKIFTCRSLDIVAHETGHAILDALKPGWLAFGNPPQTGGLHESFGDLTAIFLTLSQLDQVEAIIAQTKANLHDKTFLADLAEQFGLALGRPNGLRNADNDLKLSEVGTEVHAISQVFTGTIYDILADIFAFERNPGKKDDAALLHDVAQYVCSLVLRAIIAAPNQNATYAHIANNMLNIALNDAKPIQYRNFIRNRFTIREVVVSPTPLALDVPMHADLLPHITDANKAIQNRQGCCGTMQHPEYTQPEEAIKEELKSLKASFS